MAVGESRGIVLTSVVDTNSKYLIARSSSIFCLTVGSLVPFSVPLLCFFLPPPSAVPLLCRPRRGGKGVIALKFRKSLDDSLACFRVVGADDEIMLSTFQVHTYLVAFGHIERLNATVLI